MEWDAELKWLALPFGFMLQESLVSFITQSQKEAFTEKCTLPSQFTSKTSLLLQRYDNYKHVTFSQHDPTANNGRGGEPVVPSEVNFYTLFMSIWVPVAGWEWEGGRGEKHCSYWWAQVVPSVFLMPFLSRQGPKALRCFSPPLSSVAVWRKKWNCLWYGCVPPNKHDESLISNLSLLAVLFSKGKSRPQH